MQGTIAKELFELPGGAMQAAVGVSYREESIDAPSANPANIRAPYTRYYSINAVGTAGSRDVKSAFFEICAPVLKSSSSRLRAGIDEYSTGQSNFSPKVGFKFTPVEMLGDPRHVLEGFPHPELQRSLRSADHGLRVARSVELRHRTRRSAPRTAAMPMRPEPTAWA